MIIKYFVENMFKEVPHHLNPYNLSQLFQWEETIFAQTVA